jgi:hypothetical protein
MIKTVLYIFISSIFLFLSANLGQAEYVEAEIGSWFALMDDPEGNGAITAYIAKNSYNRHQTGFVMDSTTLHIGCSDNRNFIFFDFDVNLKNDKKAKHNVEYQLDEGKARKAKWELSANLKAVMARDPEALLADLLKGGEISIRVQRDDDSEYIRSSFNISDLGEAFGFVRENCKWH